jgi:predicted phage-related endonuclease
MLKNAPKAYCAVLIGGQDYREYVYERNEWLEDEILEACHKFWGMVQSGEQPEAANEDMKYLYKAALDKSIVYNRDSLDAITKLTEIKQNENLLKFQRLEQELIIKNYMQDSEYMVDNDGKVLVSWKANNRGNRTFLIKD